MSERDYINAQEENYLSKLSDIEILNKQKRDYANNQLQPPEDLLIKFKRNINEAKEEKALLEKQKLTFTTRFETVRNKSTWSSDKHMNPNALIGAANRVLNPNVSLSET